MTPSRYIECPFRITLSTTMKTMMQMCLVPFHNSFEPLHKNIAYKIYPSNNCRIAIQRVTSPTFTFGSLSITICIIFGNYINMSNKGWPCHIVSLERHYLWLILSLIPRWRQFGTDKNSGGGDGLFEFHHCCCCCCCCSFHHHHADRVWRCHRSTCVDWDMVDRHELDCDCCRCCYLQQRQQRREKKHQRPSTTMVTENN
jgi:hypothetical protein